MAQALDIHGRGVADLGSMHPNKDANGLVRPLTLSDADNLHELMIAIADRRDRIAFARLFTLMAPKVKGYLRRMNVSDEGLDDIVQDVMLLVWRRAGQFDPGKSAPTTWIFTIARNRRIDVLRRERRPQADPQDPALVQEHEAQPDDAMMAADSSEAVRDALKDLPPSQLSLLKLAYYEELTHSEIAERTGLPLGTVKSRLRLAIAKLKSALETVE